LGSLSDRWGRKPILLISLLGAGLDYLFMAYAPTMSLLFVGRIISGLTGASMAVASSYMADISTDENRSANFGLIGAAWGIGFITGPLIGGLLGSAGAQAPFLAAAGMNILNFTLGLFFLPESLSSDQRRPLDYRKMNPLTSILKILRPSPILIFVIIYFLLFLAGNVHPVNWTLYTQTKFLWTTWEVGVSLSFVGIMIAVVQGGLTRVLIPRLGENRAINFGLVIYVVSFFLYSIASAGWMMYPITALFSLSGLTMPAMQSRMARHVAANEQGELQGSLVSLGSLASIFAPLIYTPLFVWATQPHSPWPFSGIAYLTAGIICVGALVLRLNSPAEESSNAVN
jgi:DHA1 family tetracycline resistance protein-like MFS transporter